MFGLIFVATPGGPPIERRVSTASKLEGAIEDAQRLVRNTLIAGLKRDPKGTAYAIEDASGAYIGTWLDGQKVD